MPSVRQIAGVDQVFATFGALDANNVSLDLTNIQAGSQIRFLLITSNLRTESMIVTCSGTTNAPTKLGSPYYADPVGFQWFAVVASQDGTITLTADKSGGTANCGFFAWEIIDADNSIFMDGVPATVYSSQTNLSGSGPNRVSNQDLLLQVIGGLTPYTANDPVTGFTAGISISENNFIFTEARKATGIATVDNIGWPAVTNYFSRNLSVTELAVRGVPTGPTILSISASSVQENGSLTLTGINFRASAGIGQVKVGGTLCPVTSWTDTEIVVSVPLGLNKYGTLLNVQVFTQTSESSNTIYLTDGILPEPGWSYVNLSTPYSVANNRTQSFTDFVAGDQLKYENLNGLLTVYKDGHVEWNTDLTKNARYAVWTDGAGYGNLAVLNLIQGLPVIVPLFMFTP
jgi:hypothetical protein